MLPITEKAKLPRKYKRPVARSADNTSSKDIEIARKMRTINSRMVRMSSQSCPARISRQPTAASNRV